MELPELNFDRSGGGQTVLLHGKKVVGMYMQSDDSSLPWVANMLPVAGLFPDPDVGLTRTTVHCHMETSAQMWLVGTYLTILSRAGLLLPIIKANAELVQR